MDHLADSIAKLSQGRENWYIGREQVQVDHSSGENVSSGHCLSLTFNRTNKSIYENSIKLYQINTKLRFAIIKQ